MNDSDADLGLTDPRNAGVFFVTAADIAPLHAAFDKSGLLVRRIDLAGCRDKPALLACIAAALGTPDGRGLNWDSLSDAVRDLSWLPAAGHALLFENAIQLRDADEASFDILMEILEQAVSDWTRVGRPFWTFLAFPEEEFAPQE